MQTNTNEVEQEVELETVHASEITLKPIDAPLKKIKKKERSAAR